MSIDDSIDKKWDLIKDKVLKELQEDTTHEKWSIGLERIFTKFGKIENVDLLTHQDLEELWFSNIHIAHVTYFLSKKPSLSTNDDKEPYLTATRLLYAKDGNYGKSYIDAKAFLNTEFPKGVNRGQTTNILRTLMAVNDFNFSVIVQGRINDVLKYFGYDRVDFKNAESINEGFKNLQNLTETIVKKENIQGYEGRKIVWYISKVLDSERS